MCYIRKLTVIIIINIISITIIIIIAGHQDLGYFPVMLSRAFVICAMFGEKAVSEDTLLESCNEYLAPSEEQVVHEALRRMES